MLRRAPALAFLVVLAIVVAATWPLAVRVGAWHHPSAFGASHAWFGLHLHEVLSAHASLSPTTALGFPVEREGRFIGWLPALLAQPLVPLVGALTAHQLLEVLALPASAAAAALLIGRWTRASPAVVVGAAVLYACSPYLLATLAMGETPKLQAWCLPLFLWCFDRAHLERRGWAALALVVLATSFTSPYYGLALPLLAVGLGLRAPRAALGALVCTALALIPAWLYYRGIPDVLQDALFQPAMRGRGGPELPEPAPVATFSSLLLARSPDRSAFEALHVSYLGLPALVVAVVATRRARGLGVGIALVVGGVLLAMGPWLAVGGQLTSVPLPAWGLEALGYPYAWGGLYFRLVLLAALGLSIWLAAGLAGRRRAGVWMGVLVLVQLADGLRVSGLAPYALERVPARELLGQLREGAVLQLPIQEGPSQVHGQRGVLHALSHGRPTNSLPRDLIGPEAVAQRQLVRSTLGRPDSAELLRAAGFGAVVLDRTLESDTTVYGGLRRLGEAAGDEDDLRVWILDVEPRPVP